jgi:hypothetical protein
MFNLSMLMLMKEESVRLSVPVRFSYYLSRVGQHGRAKEGKEPGLYLIRDPVGRNKLMDKGRQCSTIVQRDAMLLKLGGVLDLPAFPLSFHHTLAYVAHFQTH